MQIYNTLTRKKEEIVPIQPGHIGIYAAVRRYTTISISETPVPSVHLMCCAAI